MVDDKTICLIKLPLAGAVKKSGTTKYKGIHDVLINYRPTVDILGRKVI